MESRQRVRRKWLALPYLDRSRARLTSVLHRRVTSPWRTSNWRILCDEAVALASARALGAWPRGGGDLFASLADHAFLVGCCLLLWPRVATIRGLASDPPAPGTRDPRVAPEPNHSIESQAARIAYD